MLEEVPSPPKRVFGFEGEPNLPIEILCLFSPVSSGFLARYCGVNKFLPSKFPELKA